MKVLRIGLFALFGAILLFGINETSSAQTPLNATQCIEAKEICGGNESSKTDCESRSTNLIVCEYIPDQGGDISSGLCHPSLNSQQCQSYCFVEIQGNDSMGCFNSQEECAAALDKAQGKRRPDADKVLKGSCGTNYGTLTNYKEILDQRSIKQYKTSLCSSPSSDKPWCSVEINNSNPKVDYYADQISCQNYCDAITGNCECIDVKHLAPEVTDIGKYCASTAIDMCNVCNSGNWFKGKTARCNKNECERNIDQPEYGGCVFVDTDGWQAGKNMCQPNPAGPCGDYCFAEDAGADAEYCFESTLECKQELRKKLDNGLTEGQLVLPACGCASSADMNTPISEGGCGANGGNWEKDLGSTLTNWGGGIDANFQLNGFKPFQQIGLYSDSSLPAFINTFLQFIIGISGVIVVIMIVIGGLEYVLSAASTSKTNAKERITNALIGLGLLLGSVALLNTINPALLNLNAIDEVNVTLTKADYEGDGLFNVAWGGGETHEHAMFEYINRWRRGQLSECDPAVQSILAEYWQSIGVVQWTCDGTAWSAAFISYLTNLKGWAHWQYIERAINGKKDGWGYCALSEHSPELGDLVCYLRSDINGNKADWSIERVREEKDKFDYISHCDIVVEKSNNQVEVVGGNLGHTIKKKGYSLTEGKITNSNVDIGILTKPGTECSDQSS